MEALFIQVVTRALWVTLQLALPILLSALIAGFIIGVIQSITQVQEMTLSFVPKLIVVGVVVWMFWPSMSQALTEFVVFGQEVIPLLLKAR